jgi:hypothetical protein
MTPEKFKGIRKKSADESVADKSRASINPSLRPSHAGGGGFSSPPNRSISA